MMSGCFKIYSRRECEANERDRLRMNLQQPATQHNYTQVGFKLMKVPKDVWEPLIAFYNKWKAKKKIEKWYRGATIVNSWDSPSYMVSFEDPEFVGGVRVKEQIWEGMRPVIEEWTGHKLTPTSLYGVRIYSEGSVLATHVDRLPLVSSCIINVDQDLDEPWPIEVYDHNGKAYNVTMEPGDIVLYESSTVLHGRPFPLKGRYYANVFVHFEPIDHAEMNEIDEQSRSMLPGAEPLAVRRRHGGSLRSNTGGEEVDDNRRFMVAAARGETLILRRLLAKNHDLISFSDENSWQPLHEAIRGGHLETVKYLVENGADIGARVKSGANTLGIARDTLSEGHEVINYLKGIGVPDEDE
eukprot:CAMPEP_0202960736 /NCGR_PEP_ID=MMETSP1396-20130829/4886_1 /ASSEMBLY_ACC=CAM_ASM_000872 /TAXON_ID= /ORGANISM="Pseudokeronopsis sp., Strain Brazil" /LENGTH=354 /DNA_ID=CAMNT_0049680143 /DNA_START=206 /DNA_END=1270 /DNA_ORIENTATION=+